jgi:hypothetical protein
MNEARCPAALCDQLIPSDGDPPARIGRALSTISSGESGPNFFAHLPNEQQFELLTALEEGEAPHELWKKPRAQDFLEMVLSHTMEGYYGDPRHGGNRDHASWNMVGLSYPPVRDASTTT